MSRPQSDRFGEYPKMRELVVRKDQLVAQRATPPFYLKARWRLQMGATPGMSSGVHR